MWQRNQIEGMTVPANREGTADYFIESVEIEELSDGEFPHGDDQMRAQEIEFIVEPARAVPNFLRSGNAIATRCRLAGEATTNRREINVCADRWLIHSAELMEPAEQGASGGPRERATEDGLLHAGCLTNEDDFALNCTAGNRRRDHPRTPATPQKS